MLEIKSFVFGPFQTNTYVVSDEHGHTLLIDPACSNEYEQQQLYAYINALLLPLRGGRERFLIVATHGHLDHLWGAAWACKQWNTPVYMHEADIPMAQAMQQQYDLFGINRTPEPFPIEKINYQLSTINYQLIPTPGHTPGSVCLYFPDEKILFSGDTLFQRGYGRTDLPGGDVMQLIASLRTLFDLPSDTVVYPGHGESTTIGAEKRPI